MQEGPIKENKAASQDVQMKETTPERSFEKERKTEQNEDLSTQNDDSAEKTKEAVSANCKTTSNDLSKSADRSKPSS